ncbi:10 kDa heat shock protein, mitochondrial-like, partial [Glossina fuscipes]|uniref:10 kDa heat shock protein, mitochondrial-like n=1 Tax=Glossina fuscipes TaxID=7396 RepID=A0A9C6E0F4_9MUSC
IAVHAITKIILMLDGILVQRAESMITTKGGLPEKSQTKMMQDTFVAVGPGPWNYQTGADIALSVKESARVLLPEYGGTKVQLENKKEYLHFLPFI